MFTIFKNDLDPNFKIFSYNTYKSPVSPPHINHYTEIVVCNEGSIILMVNGQKRVLNEGEGTMIHSFENHEFISSEHNLTTVFCFSSIVFSDILTLQKTNSVPVHQISTTTREYIKTLIDKSPQYPKDELEIRAILSGLLCEIKATAKKAELMESLAVCRAIMYIEKNYHEGISLQTLSRAIGINRTYASRMFPKYLEGATFTDITNLIRIQNSLKLLQNNTVAETSMEVGFGSVRQFNRIFKAIMDMTPTAYKKHFLSYDNH